MATRRAPLVRGLATGVSIAVVNGAGAAGGIVLAQKFGRSARTDGFLAAYAVYLVFMLVALPGLGGPVLTVPRCVRSARPRWSSKRRQPV